jgi:hypothetical protein
MPLANHCGGFPALRSHDYGWLRTREARQKTTSTRFDEGQRIVRVLCASGKIVRKPGKSFHFQLLLAEEGLTRAHVSAKSLALIGNASGQNADGVGDCLEGIFYKAND